MSEISNVLKSTGVALEKQAADSFGAVVDDFVRSGIPALRIPAQSDTAAAAAAARADPHTWISTSYAAALAGGTSYRPKLKFLFKVQFVFKQEAIDSLGSLISTTMKEQLMSNEFTFMIKSVDRPKIDFEYEEDVNMYNFRTKVLKKIRHRELTITFMDDVGNRVFDFFRIMMMIFSPITRRQMRNEGKEDIPVSTSVDSSSGMTFSDPSTAYDDRSQRGVVNTNVGGAIELIRVKQVFVVPNETPANAVQEVIFDFLNPRIMNFDLDDLTHEQSDANLLTMQFDYDWMEMVKVNKLKDTPAPHYNISVAGVTAAPLDITTTAAAKGNSITSSAPNPFAAILGRQAQRLVQKVSATAIDRAVQSIAGRGTFARSIAGTISGAAGGALSGTVGGLVGGASQDFLSGIVSTAKTSYTATTKPVLADSATAGADFATLRESTDGGTGGV